MKFPFSGGRSHGRGNRLNQLATHATTSALPWQAAGAVVAAGVLTQVMKPQPSKAAAEAPVEPVKVPSALSFENLRVRPRVDARDNEVNTLPHD